MDKITEDILRRRMHGLYLSRKCWDITELSREILGLHCWFHRNVAFSALIRGAGLSGWKHSLTKTWLYRGTLHGVVYEELPLLLALHRNSAEVYLNWFGIGMEQLNDICERVIALMEDGVFSRAEMRKIFASDYSDRQISSIFSPWGGVFVYLATLGRVAFRDMTSRDFDLISAEPTRTPDEALAELLYRYFEVYGPATLADAAWFFGLGKDYKKRLAGQNISQFSRIEYNKNVYYYVERGEDMNDIPELTLLSGFDPLVVSYAERGAVLPAEYKSAVVLKSGICLPTIAVNGRIAGLWNIKKREPVMEFFSEQPQRIKDAAWNMVENIKYQTAGVI